MQGPNNAVKRNTGRWVIIAAALLGVAAWFLFGNTEKKPTRPLAASLSSASEVRSRVTEPPRSGAPQAAASGAVLSRSVVSPAIDLRPVLPGAPEICPQWQPNDGQLCDAGTGAVITCAYGDEEQPTVCYCGASDSPKHWKCPPPTDETLTLARCDASMPENGTACRPLGQRCHYGSWPSDMTCTCLGADDLRWSCGRREYALK
jgi:hypothetical protein